MKFEKRDAPGAAPEPNEDKDSGNKPVVVYIMILFIAAFLLMALSFLMHQRSNTEALGKLQNSVSAMQEVQAVQDKVIQLQEELDDTKDQIVELEKQLQEQENAVGRQRKVTDAMLALYTLQQQFSAGDYDACLATMQRMEDEDLIACLPKESAEVTTPAQRYEQLKEAVLNK